MPGIDLHTHTVYSDGTFTPTELIALARDRGLDGVAVTDHDTTNGLVEAGAAGAEAGVEVAQITQGRRGNGIRNDCVRRHTAVAATELDVQAGGRSSVHPDDLIRRHRSVAALPHRTARKPCIG